MSMADARAIADVEDGSILATVTIASSPDRVFRALTSEEVVAWWGSDETYRTTAYSADLVEGGEWRAEGRNGDGSPYEVRGNFLEIDPPRKLVQTWRADWDGGEPTTLTWLLEATDGGTRLTLRHVGFKGRPDSCRGHAAGWEMVLGWLERHLVPGGDAASYFLCRLLPPRPSFPFDMSEEEGAIMGEHVAYWSGHIRAGRAIVFGPVADPNGAWGLGVLRVADEAAVRTVEAEDPAIRSGKGFRYEILPMLDAVVA